MTSGRINRNVYVHNARGWRVTYSTVRSPYTSCVVMYRLSFGETQFEPGDTELPRLASENVLWRTTGANSSSVAAPNSREFVAFFVLRTECPYSHKGFGASSSSPFELRRHQGDNPAPSSYSIRTPLFV